MIAFNMDYKDIVHWVGIHYVLMGLLVVDIFVNLNTAIFYKGKIT